jgi:PA14 domain
VIGGRDTWLAALLFTALTALLAYPISLHPYSLRFPTGPDGDLGWYLLGWNTHAFLHKPWAIFDANIYYPNRLTLAYGENVIGISFFAAPIIWLTGDLLLAANFVCLLSTVLCGLGAYVLARRVGLSTPAALICGVIFLASPPRFFRIGQMNLTNIQWIPFGLAALHAYFDTGRRRDLWLAALFTTLQALSSGHGAVFMGVALLVFFIYRFALGEPLNLLKRIRDLGFVGALLLAPTLLVFLPYRAVQTEVGLKRGLGTWIANYGDFIASPSHLHRFLLSLTTGDGNAPANAFLFPGYLAIALAVIAIAWTARTSRAAPGRPPFRIWSNAVLALELTLLVAAAVAGLLTAATLILLKAGTAWLVEPATARRGLLLVAGLAALGAALARWLPAATVARHRRPLLLLLAVGLAWGALGLLRPTLRAGDGLTAHYFNNDSWNGWPVGSFVDTRISTGRMRERWNGFPPERFSARWIGFLAVGQAGRYRFSTTSDDGSRLYIDEQLVVDNGGAHSAATRSGEVELTRGPHRVRLDYVQVGGDTELSWTWARGAGRDRPVPAWLLSRRPVGFGTALAARAVDFALFVCTLLVLLAAVAYVRVGMAGSEVARWSGVRRKDPTTFYAVLAIVTFGLALGPPFGLWQYVYSLPGFSMIRAHSRFTLVGLLALAVLAGIGFDRITVRLTRPRRTILAAVACVLLVAEYASMPLAVLPRDLHIPAIDRWLNTQPKPFVVAEVPVQNINIFGVFEQQEATYMLHSTAHYQKTVHGYSGWRTAFHQQLYSEMQTFPDETSVTRLADLGVTHVVVHTDFYRPGEWSGVEERLQQFSAWLRLEHTEGAGRVYSLVKPEPASTR